MPVRNINDGAAAPPRLRLDLNAGTLLGLLPDSAGPTGDIAAQMTANDFEQAMDIRSSELRGVSAAPPRKPLPYYIGRPIGSPDKTRARTPGQMDTASKQAPDYSV